jgi:hypothetical protein
MPDTRQELIDAVDALTPEQQRRMLAFLRSLSSGDDDAPSAQGDGAVNTPRPAESEIPSEAPASHDQDSGESAPEVNARDSVRQAASHSSEAKDVGGEECESAKPSGWTRRAREEIDRLADAEGHEPVDSDEFDKIIYGL